MQPDGPNQYEFQQKQKNCSRPLLNGGLDLVSQLKTQLEIALYLALLGFYVFPVCSRTHLSLGNLVRAKHPFYGFKWKERSSNDPDKIREMWREYPDGVVAIHCGKSGLLVIDPDRKAGEADGVAAWSLIWEVYPFCWGHCDPHPLVVRTPNNGEHWYFRQPAGREPLGDSRGNLPGGIDVRGAGYVLAPGAVIETGKVVPLHSNKGGVAGYLIQQADGSSAPLGEPVPLGTYRQEAGDLSAIPEAPAWLVEMIEPVGWAKPRISKPALNLTPSELDQELITLKHALRHIPAHDRVGTWAKVTAALTLDLGEASFDLWDAWGQTAQAKYDYEQNMVQWDDFTRRAAEGKADRAVTLGTVYFLADHYKPGWRNDPALKAEQAEAFKKTVVRVAEPEKPQGGSQTGEGAPAAAQAPMASLPPFQQPLVTPLLPVEEFNFDLLPRPLRGWAQDIQERLQCPPDFIGPSALVVLGSILGARIVVRPLQNDRSWNEAANNYGMTVADPGAKKSPAQSAVLSPLKRIEKAAREQYERALQRFEVGKKLKEAANTSIEKAAIDRTKQSAKIKEITRPDIENEIDAIIDGTKSIEGDAPRDKCYIANDINSASLSELLRDNPDGILISRDELMALLQLSENENAGDMRQLFLEGWQGLSSHLVHRIKRGRVYIPNLCISVLGGIQPGVIAPYIHAAQSGGKGADGFLERFQFAVWPDKPKELYKVNDKPRNFELEKQAFAAFEGLAKLTAEDCEAQTDKDAEGNPYGHPYLNFTLEAQGVFNNWLEATENYRRRDENSEPIDGHLSKYPKLVASMALLYHLVEKGRGPIPLAALQKALWLAAYLETHARRIYDSGSLAVYNAAKLVIKKAKRGQLPATGFTARDVYRKGWGQAADKELVQDALDLLMEHGWIMSQEVQNPKGGPSTSKYVLRVH